MHRQTSPVSRIKLSSRNIKKSNSKSYLSSFLETKNYKRGKNPGKNSQASPLKFKIESPWSKNISIKSVRMIQKSPKTLKPDAKSIKKILSSNSNYSKKHSTSVHSEISHGANLVLSISKGEARLRSNSAEAITPESQRGGSKKFSLLQRDEKMNPKIFKTANPEVIQTLENFLQTFSSKKKKLKLKNIRSNRQHNDDEKIEKTIQNLSERKKKSSISNLRFSSPINIKENFEIKNKVKAKKIQSKIKLSNVGSLRTPKHREIRFKDQIKRSKKSSKKRKIKHSSKKIRKKSKSVSKKKKKKKLDLDNLKKTLRLSKLDNCDEEQTEINISDLNSNVMSSQIKKTLKQLKRSGISSDNLRKIEVIFLNFLNFAMKLENNDIHMNNMLADRKEEAVVLNKRIDELKGIRDFYEAKMKSAQSKVSELEDQLKSMQESTSNFICLLMIKDKSESGYESKLNICRDTRFRRLNKFSEREYVSPGV